METNYGQYRDEAARQGQFYQDFVTDVLMRWLRVGVNQYSSKEYQYALGEGCTGIEVKHDRKYAATGNLWIERGEKGQPRPGDYAPSGIERNDLGWLYVIGNFDRVFVFCKAFLRRLANDYPMRENRTKTSYGYLLPGTDAEQYAAKVIDVGASHLVIQYGYTEDAAHQLHEWVVNDMDVPCPVNGAVTPA